MGDVIICKYMMAKKPFVIEKENLNIYSTEELCFYLTHHIYDVDNTIINGKLATWLQEEIGAVRTSGILNQQIAGRTPIIKMMEMLLLDFDYLSKDDISKIIYKQALPITPAQEAENLGNMFLQQGKFEKAVKAFRKNLRYRKQEREDDIGEAVIYEKIGIAYARLFLYNEAAESFALSYMKNPISRTMELYKSTVELGAEEVPGMTEAGLDNVRMFYNNKNSLEQKIIDNTYKDIVAKVNDIHELKEEGKEIEYQENLKALIDEIKEDAKKQLM